MYENVDKWNKIAHKNKGYPVMEKDDRVEIYDQYYDMLREDGINDDTIKYFRSIIERNGIISLSKYYK